MTDRPLSVVVVAYGRSDLLRACLAPLADTLPVVVVDNARDASCAEVCADLGVRYVDPGTNLGFAAGVNRGLDEVDAGHDVLLLNPDALVTASAVASLHSALRAVPRTAAVGPAQAHPETGEGQRVVWPFPTPGREWLIALGLGSRVTQQDFLIGSVLLVAREALDEVGRFDERFFLYAEETDWQHRATTLGWSVRLVPEVTASHVGAASSSDPAVQEAHFFAATEIYARKWYGARGWALWRLAMVVGALPRTVLARGERRAAARRRLRILLAGPVRHRREVLAR